MNSSSATVNYQMKALVGTNNYYRFQVPLDRRSTDIDDAGEENIKRLETLARMEIQHNSKKIEQVCHMLTFNAH